MFRISVLVGVVALLMSPAAAQDWGTPTVEYSAMRHFSDARGETISHRFFFAPRQQRLDYGTGKRAEITIVDQIEAAVFVLSPALNTYRKTPLVDPAFDFGIADAATKREMIGAETVDGIAAVKYRVESKTKSGQEYRGFAWLDAHRIVVKLDGELRQGRRWRKLAMSVTELKTGPLDPAIFQIPPGYAEAKSRP